MKVENKKSGIWPIKKGTGINTYTNKNYTFIN